MVKVNSKESKDSKNNEILLFSRGGIFLPKKFIYEPVGDYFYCVNFNGYRAEVKAQREKSKWFLEIGEAKYYFKDEAMKNPVFRVPDADLIESWVKGETPSYTNKEIFEKVYKFYQVCIDVVEKHQLLNPALATLQSWAGNLLELVFYCGFSARWGGGKTKGLEGFSCIAYHGFLIGDTSQSAMVRLIETQGLSICVDELDVVGNSKGRDNDLYKSFRQGYRKGNHFVRMDPNDLSKFVLVDGFGSKCYTFVDEVEGAIQQRSLITSLRPTQDSRLPVVDIFITQFGKHLFEKIWVWYMDGTLIKIGKNVKSEIPNGKEIIDEENVSLPFLRFLPSFSEGSNFEEVRQELYEEITKDFSKKQLDFLEAFTGRNTELAYNVVILSRLFELDIIEEIQKCFLDKEEADKGFNDNVLMDLLRKVLIDKYNEQSHNYKVQKGEYLGCFFYPKNAIYESYRVELKAKDYHSIDTRKFKGLLKEFSFLEGVNIKRELFEGRNLFCLIYDPSVMSELGIQNVTEESIGDNGGSNEK